MECFFLAKKNYKLFPRGKKGIFYFRVREAGKDKWVSTKTTDRSEAESFADTYGKTDQLAGLTTVNTATAVQSAKDLADFFVEKYTGSPVERIQVANGHDVWEKHEGCSSSGDVSTATQKYRRTIYSRFAEWCKQEGIAFIEHVDSTVAVRYAAHLWNDGITAGTFNSHISHLSRVFAKLDAFFQLPNRNPFVKEIVKRKSKKRHKTASHRPLESDAVEKVIAEAAKTGRDYRDLMIIGANTGMRLKDAVLLKWEFIDEDLEFIRFIPHKTNSSDTVANVPIAAPLREILANRRRSEEGEYVLSKLARSYLKCPTNVAPTVQRIFERVLNTKGNIQTQVPAGNHRKRNTAVIGFHSWRATFMSLLASRDVSFRDAQRIMGWNSLEMIQLYEHLLEQYRGSTDVRTKKLVDSIDELKFDIPELPQKLVPTKGALSELVGEYSNTTIGKIYGVTEAAVRKWLKQFGVERTRHIINSDDVPIEKIRKRLEEEADDK